MEEALIEMYLAGVSVRRVEDITEALWGSKVSPATISERSPLSQGRELKCKPDENAAIRQPVALSQGRKLKYNHPLPAGTRH